MPEIVRYLAESANMSSYKSLTLANMSSGMLENSYGKEQKVVIVNKSERYAWIGTAVSTFAEKIIVYF